MILLSRTYFHGCVDQQTVVAGVEASKAILEGFFLLLKLKIQEKPIGVMVSMELLVAMLLVFLKTTNCGI